MVLLNILFVYNSKEGAKAVSIVVSERICMII